MCGEHADYLRSSQQNLKVVVHGNASWVDFVFQVPTTIIITGHCFVFMFGRPSSYKHSIP